MLLLVRVRLFLSTLISAYRVNSLVFNSLIKVGAIRLGKTILLI